MSADAEISRRRFAEVFLPHLVDAFRLARWLAGSRTDADDIVQEASLRAFKAIGTYAGGNARAWVLTIVRNTSYRWLAKNRPSALVLTADLDERTREKAEQTSNDAEVDGPEAALIAKTEAAEMRKAIAALPASYREILVLREIHELNYRDMAGIVEVPIGTVMSRLARARKLLLAAIQENAK